MRMEIPQEADCPQEPLLQQRPESSRNSHRYRELSCWKNWWYYHKWYLICGFIALGILVNIIGNALGLWSRSPDLQVAYIGKTQLPPDTISALEQAFSLAASDLNKDEEIIVKINQYTDGLEGGTAETLSYEYASEIPLIGDISGCESYFFLMDDPLHFQREYQLLAAPDGSCPEDTDYSVEDKVIPWPEIRLFSGMDLGTYSSLVGGEQVTGSNQELLSGLYIGRRCFFTDDITDNADQCSMLWDLLCEKEDMN